MKHASIRLGILSIAVLTAVFGCGGERGSGYVPPTVAGSSQRQRVYGGPMLEAEVAEESVVQQMAAPAGQAAYAQHRIELSPESNTERYRHSAETGFLLASEQPLSTFSVDVDTASYSNVRRYLSAGQRPPPDAVRVEELINYFSYDLPAPHGDERIAVATEVAQSPFDARRALVRVGLRAGEPAQSGQPPRSFVFLIDVSGSMQDENKLPLLKHAMALLVEQMSARDRIAIVTYAGNSGVVLPPTRGHEHHAILNAIETLQAGGSTNGAAGIQLAYQLARSQCSRGDNCRVLLATDGDFNVGVTDEGSLVRLIERERDAGVFLTVLGFGMGNLNDSTMEQLADHGNGSYAYIDTLREARKVLVEQAAQTLRTVAKDTKIQIEWNPARVERYRLIGYENRRLNDADFNDDKKDAGEMGDGQSVTALYEIELRGAAAAAQPQIDPLKYQAPRAPSAAAQSDELLTIKVRYKQAEAAQSRLLSTALRGDAAPFARASDDMRFAAAVAGFGMLLRESEFAGTLSLAEVERIARAALGADRDGYRHEFLELVAQARGMFVGSAVEHAQRD